MTSLRAGAAIVLGALLGLGASNVAASDVDRESRELITPSGWEQAKAQCASGADSFVSPELLTPDGWNDNRSRAQQCWADSAYSELVVPAAWERRGPSAARAKRGPRPNRAL